jgi:hypothetical protein
MLQITIPSVELWDESKQEFLYTKERTLQLEHSLVSLSKWESKWHKPFLTKEAKTTEETIDYIRCMTITQNVDPDVYKYITNDIINQVNEYIGDPMTATWFTEDNKGKRSSEQITAELIYYSMIALQIPIKCEKWHLNRLTTLIKVCDIKNRPPKKMSKRDAINQTRALNAARRKKK